MPAEASSSCPSDAKREATNANARYGVDDPFDRERPPPTERRTKETSSNDDYSKAALALGRPSHDGTLCPGERQKSLRRRFKRRRDFCAIDDDDDFDEIPIHTHRRRVCSALSSAREWPSRRLWSCLASSSPRERRRLFQALCRHHRCRQRRRPKMPCLSLSLSSMKMDSMDEKKVKKKKKKKKNS